MVKSFILCVINNSCITKCTGAAHGTDYVYWCCVANRDGKSPSQVTPKDREMIDTMTNLLTTFAKTG